MDSQTNLRQSDWDESTSTNLLNRVVAGEEQAWKRFVRIYSALIYAKCRSRNLSSEDAADVVQDVFRRVHQSLCDFRKDKPEHGFRRWLRVVARNAVTDHLRRQSPHRQVVSADTIMEWFNEIPFLAEEDSDEAKSTTQFLIRQTLAAIQDDHEERTWQAFWKSAVEGDRCADVARDLGMSAGSVRQAKHKILKRLRAELKEWS